MYVSPWFPSRNPSLGWAVLLTLWIGVPWPLPLVSARELNVVFLLVDDWGHADAGVLGSDFFETPHIDRFARQSMRFTQAYAASPVCSPTRAAILTGKHPARLHMTIWHEGAVRGGTKHRRMLEARAQPNLPRQEVTLAELFKSRGYATAHVGKWHLGTAAYYPETQGFDVNYGGTYWGAPATFFFPYRGPWSANDPELRYVPVGAGKPGDYLTDRLTEHALRTLEEHREEPFYLQLWFHTVHTPIEGKPETVEHFAQKAAGKLHRHASYAAMIASLDENVGRVLDKLEELDLVQDTVVILTSDNGGVDFATAKSAEQPPTDNFPLRAGKGTLYEGGIRVPLLVRWPRRTPPGSTCDAVVTSQDFYPTLAAGVAGLTPQEVPRHDGVSLLSLVEDPQAQLPRRQLFWHYPHYYPRMTPGSAIRADDWKLIHFYEEDRMELYDLEDDPGEANNLASRHPDHVRRLRARLDEWRMSVAAQVPRRNPTWKPPGNASTRDD